MLRPSHWVLPIISGVVWLGMLLGLLIYWNVDTGRYIYPWEGANQTIAYISDVGAGRLKPLFIAGCVVTTIFLDLSFGSDRWLRHRGRLVPNTTTTEKVLSGLTIVFAIVGTVGLILLSIFDTAQYKRLHDIFLLLFIAGYIISAIFICWEYQRLGVRYRDHRELRISFWIKLFFIIIEVILAIAFGACNFKSSYNAAAVLEWAVAFIFSFYIFSFYYDLFPAVRTGNASYRTGSGGAAYKSRWAGNGPVDGPAPSSREMEEGSGSHLAAGGPGYHNGGQGYHNGGVPATYTRAPRVDY